jgi:hypothetical protein
LTIPTTAPDADVDPKSYLRFHHWHLMGPNQYGDPTKPPPPGTYHKETRVVAPGGSGPESDRAIEVCQTVHVPPAWPLSLQDAVFLQQERDQMPEAERPKKWGD